MNGARVLHLRVAQFWRKCTALLHYCTGHTLRAAPRAALCSKCLMLSSFRLIFVPKIRYFGAPMRKRSPNSSPMGASGAPKLAQIGSDWVRVGACGRHAFFVALVVLVARAKSAQLGL